MYDSLMPRSKPAKILLLEPEQCAIMPKISTACIVKTSNDDDSLESSIGLNWKTKKFFWKFVKIFYQRSYAPIQMPAMQCQFQIQGSFGATLSKQRTYR